MIDSVKFFIEEHIRWIDDNEFDKLYEEAAQYLTEEFEDQLTPYLTETLLECGIYPLKYLSSVPKFYFIGIGDKTVILPNNIEKLCENCLSPFVRKIQLSKNLNYLDLNVFNHHWTHTSITLRYPGTLSDFLNNVKVKGYTTCQLKLVGKDGRIPIVSEDQLNKLRNGELFYSDYPKHQVLKNS